MSDEEAAHSPQSGGSPEPVGVHEPSNSDATVGTRYTPLGRLR